MAPKSLAPWDCGSWVAVVIGSAQELTTQHQLFLWSRLAKFFSKLLSQFTDWIMMLGLPRLFPIINEGYGWVNRLANFLLKGNPETWDEYGSNYREGVSLWHSFAVTTWATDWTIDTNAFTHESRLQPISLLLSWYAISFKKWGDQALLIVLKNFVNQLQPLGVACHF